MCSLLASGGERSSGAFRQPVSRADAVAVSAHHVTLGNLSFDLCHGGAPRHLCQAELFDMTRQVVEVKSNGVLAVAAVRASAREFDRLDMCQQFPLPFGSAGRVTLHDARLA